MFKKIIAGICIMSLIGFLAYVFTTEVPKACADADLPMKFNHHWGIFSMLTFFISGLTCAVMSFFKEEEPTIYND